MADYGFKGFEKAFTKAIPSYDETKFYFQHARKKHEGTTVCFVYEGRVLKVAMYLCDYEIEQWSAHFEEFCATGEFDMHVYHTAYKSVNDSTVPHGIRSERYGTEVFKHPLEIEERGYRKGYLKEHTQEWHDFMRDYRAEHGDCGFSQVGKETK
jgi:hypothetical protein